MVGSSLPINASLASALATHGVPNNTSTASGSASSTEGQLPARNTRTKTSIQALAVHPSLPRVAYLEEETESVSAVPTKSNTSPSSKKKKSSTASPQTFVKSQRLIIQQYYNRRHGSKVSSNNNTINQDTILATLPMEKLPPHINHFRQPKSKSSKVSNQPLTLASMGPLQSITFLDREALFWQTARRQYGSLSNLGMGGAALVDRQEEVVVLRADSDLSSANNGGMGHGLCLGLQFSRVLVVLRFNKQHDDSTNNNTAPDSNAFTVLCCLEGQRTVSSGRETKVQYTPTSAAVPLSNSIVVYGCSDGAMRFHNLVPSMLLSSRMDPSASSSPSSAEVFVKSTKQRQSTIKSVRGPNGRNDPVVKILNVDPAYNESNHFRGGETQIGLPTQVGNSVVTESDESTLVLRSRLLTVCSSGVAFLWDIHIMIDRSSGALRDLNVLPPLVRLDGMGSLTISPRKSPPATQARAGSFWSGVEAPKSKEGSSDAPYSTVAPSMSYDPHRQLLVWAIPSEAPVSSIDHRGDYELESFAPNSPQAKKDAEGRAFLSKWSLENGGFVKVWDFSLVDALINSAVGPSSSPRPPPKMPPIAIMKLPTSVKSAASTLSMITGLAHAPITTASLACVCLSKDGSKLLVHAAPLPSAVDNTDDQEGTQSSLSVSPVKSNRKKLSARVVKPKILFVNYTPCHAVSLANGALSPFVRGSAVSASYFSPDTVVVATDQGVAIANLADGESWASRIDSLGYRRSKLPGTGILNTDKSRTQNHPPNIPAGPIHTIISVGGVGNRPGVLFVENHAVYASRLSTIRTANDHNQALVEKVDLHDPLMLCKLHGKMVPWKTTRSTRISHIVDSFQSMKCPPRLISSPSGRYLCLYWEGAKSYEILHAGSLLAREQNNPGSANAIDGQGQRVTPSVDSGSNVMSFGWVGDDDNFAILRRTDLFPAEPKSQAGDLSGGSNTTPFPSKGNQSRPQVELFKLAAVKVDAVELAAGASVAAATTVSLGSLTVRGGDRFIPNVIFGGPALCVGCLSMSDRSNVGNDEGIAYFYSRKRSALENNDERASAYMTIGTSIPYPDLVTWDDCGQLCATSYGSRVAVYRSEKSQFVLLGSVQLVGSEYSDTLPLVSMKFVHSVLYCSTQSTVHAIFLGNLDEENTICELDAFMIASGGVPLYGVDNPHVSSPVPVTTALIQPHILAYHSGALLVSTACGLRLLPLSHPIIRIGTLLAANLTERARKWMFASPKSEHDNLAHFLIRRGHADLAISDLNGLSLETIIDLCMRYERTDELEHLLDAHGSEIIPEICDWGRESSEYSAFFAIAVYMLAKDKIECCIKLISQAAESGVSELLVDAMKLGTFISALDQPEGTALLREVMDAMNFTDGQLALVNIVN